MTSRLLITTFAILCSAFSVDNHNTKPQTRGACSGNTPSTRDQWCDFDIHTDYNRVAPDTGVTREYWLEVTDVIVAPDGFKRPGQAINGTIPGTIDT